MSDIAVLSASQALGNHNESLKFVETSDDDSRSPIVKKKSRFRMMSGSDSDKDNAFNSIKPISIVKNKSRVRMLSASDSEDDGFKTIKPISEESNNEDDYTSIIKRKNGALSRIKSTSSQESDSDNQQHNIELKKNNRITNKRVKIRNKFKSLLNSREKNSESLSKDSNKQPLKINDKSEDYSYSKEDEIISVNEIKETIKQRSNSLKITICDPDTSDEDTSSKNENMQRPKNQQKRTKLTSPKPQRISAKQASENMQKIKSESNRMLREKEVSLPYHRPKALNLKDIINRRKPAVSSDGKALPIKMNAEQLKQYACLLEERHKEIMELCKSDTDEDEPENDELNSESNISTITIAEKKYDCTEKELQINKLKCDPNNLNINSESSVLNDIQISNVSNNDEKYGNDCNPVPMPIEETPSVTMNKNVSVIQEDEICCRKYDDLEIPQKESKINICIESNYDITFNGIDENVNKKSGIENMSTEERNDNQVALTNAIVGITECLKKDEVKNALSSVEINSSENESQLISLQYDSEVMCLDDIEVEKPNPINKSQCFDKNLNVEQDYAFPDDNSDLDIDVIDSLIEKAETINNENMKELINSPVQIKEAKLGANPKLTGEPGTIIDLDLEGGDAIAPAKLSGVELLKERFIFYAKLKTPEELDRDKEKKQKPGTQHIKLKQELEDKIAEQRSIEWAKRLENAKQQQDLLQSAKTDSSNLDDIDKIDQELEETENDNDILSTDNEDDEDLIENDVLIEDKPRKNNPLLADEAEESDLEETDHNFDNKSEDNCSSEDDSSESEEEDQCNIPRKSRILKAFEDSDDDDDATNVITTTMPNTKYDDVFCEINDVASVNNQKVERANTENSNFVSDSQDDVLHLAQIPKKISEDLFTSQESNILKEPIDQNIKPNKCTEYVKWSPHTFSILNESNTSTSNINLELDTLVNSPKFDANSETLPFDDNLDAVVGMCSGSFSQNYIEISPPKLQTQDSQSENFGEDLLDMCTGKFYDNQFISQTQDSERNKNKILDISEDSSTHKAKNAKKESFSVQETSDEVLNEQDCEISRPLKFLVSQAEDSELNMNKILDISEDTRTHKSKNANKENFAVQKTADEVLNEQDCEISRPLKFFFDGDNKKENKKNISNTHFKKKNIIDSDDETIENPAFCEKTKIKRLKRRKLENRVLQISDDEDETGGQDDDLFSGSENVEENEDDRLVEYDSEENEIEVRPQNAVKNRKAREFFEQEAELTSEDEWVGSGDEDEADLDRMEREAGDDDTFNQNKLQRELGQIHMRDVLDQDKREVRIIQELLFEDGDLGGGGRQRQFRWRNADGDEETGTVPDEFADTQEDEFESEEQWRKQRHERDMFLRQMKNEEEVNVTLDRTAIIKANLISRTMSSLLEEANQSKAEEATSPPAPDKKTTKDIPSPKKPYAIFQKNYHGSLLSRGRGALERLAALATPLAGDDDKPASVLPPSTRRNFVFAALTPDTEETKVTKRKAETAIGTPQLVKKMRTEDKKPKSRSSLLDHFKA